jgi:hypothetical protein
MMTSSITICVGLWAFLTCMASIPAAAGTRPQVDLSVSVTTSPVPFVPGGIVTVTMTVHNAGPETAGAMLPNQQSIVILEKPYDLVDHAAPFVLFEPATGCNAYAHVPDPIPGVPGGGLALLFTYYFDAIGPGQSRTCVYRLRILPSTQADIATYWETLNPNEDDINPSNNRFDYTFIAAEPPAPVAVPALSPIAGFLLGIGLLLTPMFFRTDRSL